MVAEEDERVMDRDIAGNERRGEQDHAGFNFQRPRQGAVPDTGLRWEQV